MQVTIKKSNISGDVFAPPSKSMAHRFLVCAGLSNGQSTINNITYSDDVLATINCLKALGVEIAQKKASVMVKGINIQESTPIKPLECNECGSTLRFFIPIALLLDKEVILKGSTKLISRPVSVYEELSKEKGFLFQKTEDKILLKGKLKSGDYYLPGNISSQFVSGLLFALGALGEESTINLTTDIESRSYVLMTLEALRVFGVIAFFENDRKIVLKKGKYKPSNIVVEGDCSNAAFLDAFNYIGGNVKVKGLNHNTVQGDRVYKEYFQKLANKDSVLDVTDCPDLAPVLFALAAAIKGGTFIGTRRLKLKESDRAESMAAELRKFGTNVKVFENKVIITKEDFYPPKYELYGHNDHRVVMALATLLTVCGGKIIGAEAVNKSYPDFFDVIKSLNCELEINEN